MYSKTVSSVNLNILREIFDLCNYKSSVEFFVYSQLSQPILEAVPRKIIFLNQEIKCRI